MNVEAILANPDFHAETAMRILSLNGRTTDMLIYKLGSMIDLTEIIKAGEIEFFKKYIRTGFIKIEDLKELPLEIWQLNKKASLRGRHLTPEICIFADDYAYHIIDEKRSSIRIKWAGKGAKAKKERLLQADLDWEVIK